MLGFAIGRDPRLDAGLVVREVGACARGFSCGSKPKGDRVQWKALRTLSLPSSWGFSSITRSIAGELASEGTEDAGSASPRRTADRAARWWTRFACCAKNPAGAN